MYLSQLKVAVHVLEIVIVKAIGIIRAGGKVQKKFYMPSNMLYKHSTFNGYRILNLVRDVHKAEKEVLECCAQ